MKLKTYLLAFALICLLSAFSFSQSQSNRIWRPCKGSLQQAAVEIDKSGNIRFNPCPESEVLFNGSPMEVTGLASLNGLSGSSQTFGVGTANTAAWSSSSTTHTLNLPISSVSGIERIDFVPFFTGENELGKSGISQVTSSTVTDFYFRHPINKSGFSMWLSTIEDDNNFGFFQVGAANNTLTVSGEESISELRGENEATLRAGSLGSNGAYLSIASPVASETDGYFLFRGRSTNGTIRFDVSDFEFSRSLNTTPGAITTTKAVGTVVVPDAETMVIVNNANVNADSIVLATARAFDATCGVKAVQSSVGQFIIHMTAACTDDTSVGFWVMN